MATPSFPFHDSQWRIDYHAACIEPSDSLRPKMVESAIFTCNEALLEALSSEERVAVYTALRDLTVLRLTQHRHERMNSE
jgi:TorA maturation chaperone TorD